MTREETIERLLHMVPNQVDGKDCLAIGRAVKALESITMYEEALRAGLTFCPMCGAKLEGEK